MKTLIKGIVIATMALSAGIAVAGDANAEDATFQQAKALYSAGK